MTKTILLQDLIQLKKKLVNMKEFYKHQISSNYISDIAARNYLQKYELTEYRIQKINEKISIYLI